MSNDARILQEEYYKKTAEIYNVMHVHSDIEISEHNMGLHFLSAMIRHFGIKSILDVGSGTGRVISFIKREFPDVRIIGIEPVKELREQGYQNGISPEVLVDGDGNQIDFNDNQFDLVCEFGMLHHVPHPDKVVSEMLRVAHKYIFISDSNNFGQGSFITRIIKQTINFVGLWKCFNYLRTLGRNYQLSEGDGLFYSYSVFNNLKQIRKNCTMIYFFNTSRSGVNLYRTAPHIALLARKNNAE